jgi:hypothetical protein
MCDFGSDTDYDSDATHIPNDNLPDNQQSLYSSIPAERHTTFQTGLEYLQETILQEQKQQALKRSASTLSWISPDSTDGFYYGSSLSAADSQQMAEMETGDVHSNEHGRKRQHNDMSHSNGELPREEQFAFRWPASQTSPMHATSKDKINELKETALNTLRPLEKRYGKCLAHKDHLGSANPAICLASLKKHIGLPNFHLERYADEGQLPLIQSLTYDGHSIVEAIDSYLQEVNDQLLVLFRALREAECAALKTQLDALHKEYEAAFTALLPSKTADNEELWDALVAAGMAAIKDISKECTSIQTSAKDSVKTPSLPAAKRAPSQLSQQSTQEETVNTQQQPQRSAGSTGSNTTATAPNEDELNLLKAKVLSLEDAQNRAANEKRKLEQQLSTLRGHHHQQSTQQKNESRGGRGNHPSLPTSPYPYTPRGEPPSWHQTYPPPSHRGYYGPPPAYSYPPYPYHAHMDPSLMALNTAPSTHPLPHDAVGARGRDVLHDNMTGRGYKQQRGRGGRGGRLQG